MSAQPKPRMGDYYAGLSELEWERLWKPGNRDIWRIAYRLFCGDDGVPATPEESGITFDHWLEASDAFAFGATKYGVGCWREVSSEEHLQGAGRHLKDLFDDWDSRDLESRLLHRKHFLARAIMCLEQRRAGK